MELDKFHILKRYSCLVGEITSATGVSQCIGRFEIDSAITSCRKDDCLSVYGDDPAFKEMERKDAEAFSFSEDKRESIPLFINRNLKASHLLVENVEEVVAGSIGSITGPGKTCSAKRPLGNLPVLSS
jgi:hypothetical protein